MDNSVLKRDITEEIISYLGTDNILVLHGARQVGKTHILYYLDNYLKTKGEKTFYFDLEDSRLVDLLNLGVDSFLTYLKEQGGNPKAKLTVFIDEIQYLDKPSPFLKLLGDHHKNLQLIISGSSSFNIKSKFSDSLSGRTVNFEIYPLSFTEFLRFKNQSAGLLEEKLRLYREYVNFGGYPKIVLENDVAKKERYLLQIIDTYVRKDIRDLAQINNIRKFNDLLKVLASQQGQLLNVTNLSGDLGIIAPTLERYLSLLEETFVIKLVPPFSTDAKVEVSKARKVFFYDTGLSKMLYLKNLTPEFTSNVFEVSIFSELVKKYGVNKINFWRNKNGNEIDFILQNKDILPIEVKSNFNYFTSRGTIKFCRKYKLPGYKVVGLDGTKSQPEFIYPWEL